MDPDRRRFLAATAALATSGLGLAAAAGVTASGGYELVPTEFESKEVLEVRPPEEPAPRRNYLAEARALGLEVRPPRPAGANLYPSSRDGEPHYAYWSCLFSEDLFVSEAALNDACFDHAAFAQRLSDMTLQAWDQWRNWSAVLPQVPSDRPYRYVTTPTVVHYCVAEGQHFYTYFHVSRGDVQPTTPQEYLNTATWLASRIIRLPETERRFILDQVCHRDMILHSMTKMVLQGWREVALDATDSRQVMISVPQPLDHIDLHFTI